jgi:hypothetical protein
MTGGTPMPPAEFIGHVREFGWDETFMRSARLAALLSNGHGHQGGPVWAVTHGSLLKFRSSPNRVSRQLAEYAGANPHRPIAHESSIYFLEAMALLYGSVGGQAPGDSALAHLLLAANDYCTDWRAPDDPSLTRRESNLVNLARASIHDDSSMGVRRLVRSRLLFDAAPPVPEWSDLQAWHAFQTEAFGMPFDEYVECLAGPLAFFVAGLMSDPEDAEHPYPIVEPSLWFTARSDSKAFAAGLGITRDEAQREIQTTNEGLPIGPSLFYRRPLVEILPDKLVAASPWVLREVLNSGIWARHMAAAKRLHGANLGAQRWSAAFGYLVEGWCQKVAKWAEKAPGFKGSVLTPAVPGTEDVEDVVIVNRMTVALFSVKARLLREDLLKGALSDRAVLDWYNGFLFEKKAGAFRAGAVCQLQGKIEKIRAGHFSPHIHPDALILPVVVTFDDYGADNPSMTKWIAHRCREEGLLQQRRVRPLTMMDVDLFERLLGVSTHGHAVTDILKKKALAPWDQGRLVELLRETIRPGQFGAVPELVQAYDEIMRRMQANLFPHSTHGS